MRQNRNWLEYSDSIFHDIAGDDYYAFFGFAPNLKVVSTPVPNAFAVGSNEVVVSSSLLDLLESKSEYAFILAHELAHVLLGHSHQDDRVEEPLDALRRHIKQEFEADMLAFKLLSNTDFEPQAALNVLSRLGKFRHEEGLPTLSALYPSIQARISAIEAYFAERRG